MTPNGAQLYNTPAFSDHGEEAGKMRKACFNLSPSSLLPLGIGYIRLIKRFYLLVDSLSYLCLLRG